MIADIAPLEALDSTSCRRTATGVRPASAPLSSLERLPTWAICVPLALHWLWWALRYRSLTLPTVANPGITAGGLVGEGKTDYFRAMGAGCRAATAPWCVLEQPTQISSTELQAKLDAHSLDFPLVAKPDLGMCGHGVRKVKSLAELSSYLARFPADVAVVVQAYLAARGEAGIFYARSRLEATGRVIGIALRSFPKVIGDGHRTLAELIDGNARVCRVRSASHAPDFDPAYIPAAGEEVRLSLIGSTRVGGLYEDGAHLLTPRLAATIDAMAQDIAGFHFGRFDVRYETEDDLAQGSFTIMEVNGAGSEAIEAWDPRFSLWQAFTLILRKQRLLFRISAENRTAGARPIGITMLIRYFVRQRRLLRQYPPSS